MSAYDYEHFVYDFINRTSKNLSVINNLAAPDNDMKVYEFTQLINSLFGLLIVPFEKYKNIDEFEFKTKDGYNELLHAINKIDNLYTNYKDDRCENGTFKVTSFIKHLRNALAHSGNDKVFFLDEDEECRGILFYDCYTDVKNNKYEFCVEIDKTSFKEIVDNIIKIYSGFVTIFDEVYHNKILEKREIFKRNNTVGKRNI